MKPRELGPYLLLRKLSENALCETYRAGQHTGPEVERVVLLYLFAGDPDSALWIAETAHAGRRALAGLESPCLSPAIDSGEVDGTAYLAYDYIPGRSLESVLEKSRIQEYPVPIEHALLITDRIAQGLTAAWEHESRALHGFVVPHLVMLSNEGDVQVLGLEVASRLRKLLADSQVGEEMGGYLAPEVVPEGQPSTTDDVFSLGALLYEMLTAKSLPASPPGGVEDLIDQVTHADGSPLPEAVVALLRGSLAPSSRRMDLKSWHAKLSELLVSGEYDVNAFNLALFLHSLFSNEIESEADEDDQKESSQTVARDVEQAVADLVPVPTDKAEDSWSGGSGAPPVLVDEHDEKSTSRNRTFGIAAGVAALVLASFGAYSFFGPWSGTEAVQLDPTTAELTPLTATDTSQSLTPEPGEGVEPGAELPQTVTEEASTASPEESTASPEEIDQRVQELLSQRSAAMESSLRREFETQVATLQQQLEEARQKAATEPTAETAVAEAAVEEGFDVAAAVQTDPGDSPTLPAAALSTAPDDLETEVDAQPAERLADSSIASADMTGDTVSTATNVSASAAAEQLEAPTAGERETTAGDAEETYPQQVFTAPARTQPEPPTDSLPEPQTEVTQRPTGSIASPATATPTVQPGDLVAPGPGVSSPKIVRAAQPVYPMMARRLKREAVVTVRILVDENGRVLEAQRLGDEAGYGFDEAAMQAARKSEWQPATKDGVAVKMWWTVRIAFEP